MFFESNIFWFEIIFPITVIGLLLQYYINKMKQFAGSWQFFCIMGL